MNNNVDTQPAEAEEDLDINYFVCTLGQAAAINAKHPHPWTTVNEFIDHQAHCFPKRPAVAFPVPSEGTDKTTEWSSRIYTFQGLRAHSVTSAIRLRQTIAETGNLSLQSRTIALLCPSSIDFLLTWLALMRLGFSVLLIAPQCQPSAVAHLCKICNVSTLVFDRIYHDLATKSRDVGDSPGSLLPIEAKSVDESDENEATILCSKDLQDFQVFPISEHDVAYLHHTSGTSTGLPKPIPQSHRAAVGVLPSLESHKAKATFTTTPLYHGGVADCFRAWTAGALIWLFPGRTIPITASNILKSLDCAQKAEKMTDFPKTQYFSSVPYVLQMMAADVEGIQVLRDMDIVGVGGAALPPSVGDGLVQQGINLVSRFGSAECGFLMSSHRRYTFDKEWQFLRSYKSPHLSFEPQEGGSAELIIRPSWPHMAKRNREDGSYATADLFEKHPTLACAWRYHSRADSQLTLATGKKFDPAPLEAAIASSSLLKDVFIFGNGEQYPGALLFPSDESAGLTNQDLIDVLWPSIEQLNSESQSHSRLSKHMLVIMPANTPGLEKSSKGTIMRGVAEKEHATTIKKTYEDNSIASKTEDGAFAVVPDDGIPETVLKTIKLAINTEDPIAADADLFSYGVDSVACMRIRSLLQKAVFPVHDFDLPLNVVYDCGTIERLSKYLVAKRRGMNYEAENDISLMHSYLSEYGTFEALPNGSDSTADPSRTVNRAAGKVAILTGATGALGAHILDQLRSSLCVSKVHCLVRAASQKAANERVSKSLHARKKAPLDDTSSSTVLCHPCKLSDPGLGLPADIYTDLAKNATIVIHAAWAVNFSMRLSSFVKDHIAGLHNLIGLTLASPDTRPPPYFLFCSSTASVLGPNAKESIPEQISHDPFSASPLGYSRSKWVAERICEQAHLNTRLRDKVSVLRIGQLCGDTENGIWNATEAWPLMLSSIKAINCLPNLSDNLDWLPVDIAASAVVEKALTVEIDEGIHEPLATFPVLHILNRNTEPTWADLTSWLKCLHVSFEVIEPARWVERLEKLDGTGAKHPAKKLLGLWKDAYGNENDNAKSTMKRKVVFEMDKTKSMLETMRNVQPIRKDMFERIWGWIEREMT